MQKNHTSTSHRTFDYVGPRIVEPGSRMIMKPEYFNSSFPNYFPFLTSQLQEQIEAIRTRNLQLSYCFRKFVCFVRSPFHSGGLSCGWFTERFPTMSLRRAT